MIQFKLYWYFSVDLIINGCGLIQLLRVFSGLFMPNVVMLERAHLVARVSSHSASHRFCSNTLRYWIDNNMEWYLFFRNLPMHRVTAALTKVFLKVFRTVLSSLFKCPENADDTRMFLKTLKNRGDHLLFGCCKRGKLRLLLSRSINFGTNLKV